MLNKEHSTHQKLFLIKVYPSLVQTETAIRDIVKKNSAHLQLSVLGILTTSESTTKSELDNTIIEIKRQLSNVLGEHLEFGYFRNPEIGVLFIAGHLTPTFLNKVDERALASLPAGLFGIFRGLGITVEDINRYLSKLKNGNYFLIIRGESANLKTIDPALSMF